MCHLKHLIIVALVDFWFGKNKTTSANSILEFLWGVLCILGAVVALLYWKSLQWFKPHSKEKEKNGN